MKKLFSLFIFLAFLLSAIPSSAAEIKTVRTREELIEYITEQTEELKKNVKVRIKDYTESEFEVDFTKLLPIEYCEWRSLQHGTTAELSYEFTYTQAERLIYYLNGGNIKLSTKETETAKAVRVVFDEIISDDMTDMEKQLAIHDYILLNTEYDNDEVTGMDAHTPYGVLINNLAVCQGYAEAARILLTMSGIENDTLSGTSNGQNHMWNVVTLDGEMYHMDITWDDGLLFDDGTTALAHVYFNITDEQLGKTHRWNKDYQLEKLGGFCTASDYNYYNYNGLIITDNDDYINAVEEMNKNGEKDIEVMLDGLDMEQVDLESAILAADSSGCSYFHIPGVNVLWVRFH